MIKRILLSILMCSLVSIAFAQSLADINSPRVIPPPPEAAALGKYGQIPVDKSSGIPSISIPLYEIKTSRFSLPISLSYHASGIKVGETSTWVGAGWSLNSGGVITRSIIGLPDDGPGGFLYSGTTSWQQLININQNQSWALLKAVCDHQNDFQPDNFFYNFADKSGAFVFGPDAAKTPVLTPYKPLKISYSQPSQGTPGTFTVLDESGNFYYFNDKEIVSNSGQGISSTASWYLSQMISADKSDTLTFSYQKDTLGFNQISPSFSQLYQYTPTNNFGGGCPVGPYLAPITQTSNIVNNPGPLYIKTITFKGGKVDFLAKGSRLDGPHLSLDSVIISNYDYNQKKYNRLKSFKINTGYWTNNLPIYQTSAYTGSIYRLKLDSVVENDKNNIAVKTHKFGYDPVILPPVNYYAQDRWGYYNGKNTNLSLLEQQQAIDQTNNLYTVGNADRSTDPNSMKAGMLEQITYPTKGYTVLSYEPHQYLKYNSSTLPKRTAKSNSVGYYQETNTTYFTTDTKNDGTGTSGIVTIILPPPTAVTVTPNPYVELVRDSDGMVLIHKDSRTNYNLDTVFNVQLQSGKRYRLNALSKGGSAGMSNLPTASISISYYINPTDSVATAAKGGGLRIRSIQNYNADGTLLTTETYKYGSTENGIGVLMNDSLAFSDTTNRKYWLLTQGGLVGFYTVSGRICSGVNKIFSSNPTYSLSTLSGSPVMYGAVTIYHGDTVNNIGKSRYEYANYPDSTLTTPADYQNGIMMIPTTWKNGQVVHEAHYRNIGSSQYSLEKENYNSYFNMSRTYAMGIYVGFAYETSGFTNDSWPQPWSDGYGPPDNPYSGLGKFTYFGYPISTGSAVPSQTISINYANDGVTKLTQDTIKYLYGNHTHMYPTQITGYDGKGNSLIKMVSYPQDMSQTGIYGTMSTANIINPVIQFTQSKNSTQLMQSITNYGNSNPNSIINPSTVSLQVMGNAAETRLSYLNYDNYGNVATVAKPNGSPVSYIWGYNGSYPVAEVKNAKANDIYYESFEDGKGNTGYNDSKTGHYCYLGAYSITRTSLDTGMYNLTYWQKSGSVWTPMASTVHVTSSSYTLSVGSSTTEVDDIRFYPVGALMTTYTYDPLIGVTSTTDAKGEITYYQYDSMQRLANIRDQNNNIVKSFCYNYAGQATNCFIYSPSYSSAARDSIFYRNNCGTGYTGSAFHYILAAGAFTSNVSQTDANNQAKNDVIANGQHYANLNGSCTQNTIGFTITNTTGVAGIQITFYGSTNYTFTAPTSGSSTVQILPGTYSSMTVGPTALPHTFTLGTRTPVTYTIVGWSSVNISTGSSDLTLSIH